MPMLTTSVIAWPVAPCQRPSRTASVKARIWVRTAATLGITFSPSSRIFRLMGARSATCRTARSSVKLMRAPPNMRSRQPATSAATARSSSSLMVSSVMRFFE